MSDSILDHLGVAVSDLARSKTFYEAALSPLGIAALMDFPGGCWLDRGTHPELWLAAGKALYQTDESRVVITQQHVCLKARSRAEVDAFHAAAVAAGGKDYGAPGIRAHYDAKLLRRVRAGSGRPQRRGRLPRPSVISARQTRRMLRVVVVSDDCCNITWA